MSKKPWYKTPWKLELIGLVAVVVFGIPTYISLFKPQKAIIDKPINDLKREPKSPDHLNETEPSLAKASSLRKLKPLETGKHLNEVPDNIYGFTSVVRLSWDSKISDNVERIELSNEREIRDYFEVQKFNNKYYLIGFISDESYAKIGNVNKSNPLGLTLFALPWEEFENIVAIPFNSIINISRREINIGGGYLRSVLDIVTNNIITDTQGHDLNIK